MARKKKLVWVSLTTFVFLTAAVPITFGMHVMEGYLSPVRYVVWGIICIPFLALGIRSIRESLEEDRGNTTLLVMAEAFTSVISPLRIPSATGSYSHITGIGLGAILFGSTAVSILGIIALLFRALLLTHGGIIMLGANIFSTAVTGPLLSYPTYQIYKKGNVNRTFSVFLAALLGDILTYCVTSLQLATAYPSAEGGIGTSAVKFLGVFAPTQLLLAVIEGILTVIIVVALETCVKPEPKAIGSMKEAA